MEAAAAAAGIKRGKDYCYGPLLPKKKDARTNLRTMKGWGNNSHFFNVRACERKKKLRYLLRAYVRGASRFHRKLDARARIKNLPSMAGRQASKQARSWVTKVGKIFSTLPFFYLLWLSGERERKRERRDIQTGSVGENFCGENWSQSSFLVEHIGDLINVYFVCMVAFISSFYLYEDCSDVTVAIAVFSAAIQVQNHLIS